MKTHLIRHVLPLVLILLTTVGDVRPQPPVVPSSAREEARQKEVTYAFVSPNTRENLTLKESLRLLNSREELELIYAIRHLSTCLGLKSAVIKTIGNWTDGAEHSTMFRIYTDQATARYADARLGRRERQKSVLYFRRDAAGKGRMYVLYPRRRRSSLNLISRTLDRSGVPFRTLFPRLRRPAIIYVIDLNHELERQVGIAARRLGARLVVIKGMGEFIGDDNDREKARQIFTGIVNQYEDDHPYTKHNCSKQNLDN